GPSRAGWCPSSISTRPRKPPSSASASMAKAMAGAARPSAPPRPPPATRTERRPLLTAVGSVGPEDLAALHHEAHALQFGDVRQRITADRNQVGRHPRRQTPGFVLDAQVLGGADGGRLDRLKRRQSCAEDRKSVV